MQATDLRQLQKIRECLKPNYESTLRKPWKVTPDQAKRSARALAQGTRAPNKHMNIIVQ